jgi:hypothetical protein
MRLKQEMNSGNTIEKVSRIIASKELKFSVAEYALPNLRSYIPIQPIQLKKR